MNAKLPDSLAREMNRQVAKLMGWRWDEDTIYVPNGGMWVRYGQDYLGNNPVDLLDNVLPDYTKNGEAAMRVFDWLSGRGIVRLSNGDGDSYDLDFLPTNSDKYNSVRLSIDMLKWIGTRQQAWCHAICKGALRAAGVGVDLGDSASNQF